MGIHSTSSRWVRRMIFPSFFFWRIPGECENSANRRSQGQIDNKHAETQKAGTWTPDSFPRTPLRMALFPFSHPQSAKRARRTAFPFAGGFHFCCLYRLPGIAYFGISFTDSFVGAAAADG